MSDLRVFTEGIAGLGGQLDNVAADAANVVAGSPGLSGLLTSHGTIAFPADFSSVSDARTAAVEATKASGEKLAETLRQAAKAYEAGDTEAAERLKAQADQMSGSSDTGSSSTGTSTDASSSSSDTAGQMMGQFSQLAQQMMQGITQPVQGIMEGLGQVPEQVMQGVQGIVETATQAGADGGAAAAEAAGAGVEAAGEVGAGEPVGPDEARAEDSEGAGAPEEGQKAPTEPGVGEERIHEMRGVPPVVSDASTESAPGVGAAVPVDPLPARDA